MVPLSVDLLLVDLSIVEWFSRCPSRVGLLGKRAVVWGEAHWGEARWGEARCAEARWGELWWRMGRMGRMVASRSGAYLGPGGVMGE